MVERMKKDLEKTIKGNMIFAVIFLAILIMLWIGYFLYVLCTNEETSKEKFVVGVLLLIFSAIAIVAHFFGKVIKLCKDLKAKESERSECLKIIVIRRKHRIGGPSGYKTTIVAKNLDTCEEFEFEETEKMKENETYYMLRAKHSKLYVCEPFDSNVQES